MAMAMYEITIHFLCFTKKRYKPNKRVLIFSNLCKKTCVKMKMMHTNSVCVCVCLCDSTKKKKKEFADNSLHVTPRSIWNNKTHSINYAMSRHTTPRTG